MIPRQLPTLRQARFGGERLEKRLYRYLTRRLPYHFTANATGTGIEVLRTPIKARRANAICERLLGSVRRECLDHIVILSEAHVRRVLLEYVRYFNRSRPHQGINQRVPECEEGSASSGGSTGPVIAFPVLNGLHHEYRRVA